MTADYVRLIGPINSKTYIYTLMLVIFAGLAAEYPTILTQVYDVDQGFDSYGIANEKLYYFRVTNWYNQSQFNALHDWALDGINFNKSGEPYIAKDAIGLFGYYAGSNVYILDNLALADSLRSRLPVFGPLRIGHISRITPLGYEDTLMKHFINCLQNPDLRLYYDKLSILIHGDIFAPGRLQEIINFNLGRYDYLIKRYNDSSDPK